MNLSSFLTRAFISLLLICINACSQNDGTQTKPSTTKLGTLESDKKDQSTAEDFGAAKSKLREIPRPNAKSMEADVAELIDASWLKLNNSLDQENPSQEARSQAYADFGLVAFGNGLVLPAEAAFTNAAQLSPNEPRWTYFLALLHEYNGSLAKAASGFENVLQGQANSIPALLRLGDVRFEQSKMDAAKLSYQRALDIAPENAAALYGLGRIANANENYALAAELFEKALNLQPDADRINYFLGMIWRNLGDREKARAFFSKRGTVEPSFNDPLFDEISGGEARIEGLWAHMNAGSQAFVDGNYSLAVDEFRLATKDLPGESRSWQSLGMALNKLQDTDGAKLAYTKALELSQKNATIHHELAKLEVASGRKDAAEKHFVNAVEIDPKMLVAQKSYARFLFESGRTKDALARYETALNLDPQSADLAVSRAQTLAALGRNTEAISALLEAKKVNPLSIDIRLAYGLMLADDNKLEKAMQEVTSALNKATDDKSKSHAHYAIGRVHLKSSDPDKAIASFGSALKLNPTHKTAGLELARSFLRIRDFPQALATYETHIAYWPEYDTNRVEAARVAVMLGNGTKASKLLEEGLKNGAATARLLGTYARLLVLTTEENVRNPSKALALAQRAFIQSKASQHGETLALCFAANNNYDKAIEVQSDLLKSTSSDAGTRARTRMEKNLERYRGKTLGRVPFDAS